MSNGFLLLLLLMLYSLPNKSQSSMWTVTSCEWLLLQQQQPTDTATCRCAELLFYWRFFSLYYYYDNTMVVVAAVGSFARLPRCWCRCHCCVTKHILWNVSKKMHIHINSCSIHNIYNFMWYFMKLIID